MTDDWGSYITARVTCPHDPLQRRNSEMRLSPITDAESYRKPTIWRGHRIRGIRRVIYKE